MFTLLLAYFVTVDDMDLDGGEVAVEIKVRTVESGGKFADVFHVWRRRVGAVRWLPSFRSPPTATTNPILCERNGDRSTVNTQ